MTQHLDASPDAAGRILTRNWRGELPRLSDGLVILRELAVKDAGSLHVHLGTPAVRRHMAPPPDTVEGFQRFARWTHAQRRDGALACFALLPIGLADPVGLVQIWRVTPDFATAEWGIVLGETWWGRGVAKAAAKLLFGFAFGTLQVQRLESRIAPANERGRKLMIRLGATPHGLVPGAAGPGDQRADEELWAIRASDRDTASFARPSRTAAGGRFLDR
jgi:[ribosomal protein S5]-alanine N-acetyltransferase